MAEPTPQDLNAPQEDGPKAPTVEEQLACRPGFFRRCTNIVGSGIISGASNVDPSAIATYAAIGASLGLATLWMIPPLLVMMIVTVYFCAKLGMIKGQGLAGILREQTWAPVRYVLIISLLAANTFNAGADLGAIADGFNLLIPAISAKVFVIPITLALIVLQIWGRYRTIVRVFQWFALSLFAFVGAGLLAKPDWAAVAGATFVPSFTAGGDLFSAAVTFVGTALSPYLFFWQSTQRVEDEVVMGRKQLFQRKGASQTELSFAKWDVAAGMAAADLIIYFLVMSTASTLFTHGQHEVGSAADAARALEPIAGPFAKYLFAIGFIGAGLLAIPVLTTGAAYAISELFLWKHGLDQKPGHARAFYWMIAAILLVGAGITYLPINPMRTLVIAATINGLLTPPLLIVIMILSSRPGLMPLHPNRWPVLVLGWITAAVTLGAGVALVVSWVK